MIYSSALQLIAAQIKLSKLKRLYNTLILPVQTSAIRSKTAL